MEYRVYNISKTKKMYDDFRATPKVDESILPGNHLEIRHFFIGNYYRLKQLYDGYQLDIQLAILFYNFMNSRKDFCPSLAADYNFWRTVAVMDIPDIVAYRWGITQKDQVCGKGLRVYPYSLYWYVHMCWQGDSSSTLDLLQKFTSEMVVQFVERPSRIGINLDFYRQFVYEYSLPKYDGVKKKVLEMAKNSHNNITFLRLLLMKNTSKLALFRPEFYEGGISGYIQMLFTQVQQEVGYEC